jgi:hypothetical protein
MDPLRSHITDRLVTYTNNRSNQFDLIFHHMHHPQRPRYECLLVYVDNLLNAWEAERNEGLTSMHIHFPFFEADSAVLLEYLCIRLFVSAKKAPAVGEPDVPYMLQHIARIERALAQPMQLGEANKKKERERKTEYRKDIKKMKEVLTGLEALNLDNDRSSYRPICLVNVLTKDKNELENTCRPSPYFMTTNEYAAADLLRPISYVLLNDELSRDELDKMEIGDLKDILEHIEQVVLFNSDGKMANRQFRVSDIKKLNAEGLNIKRLLIISFDPKPLRLERLIAELNTIGIRYLEKMAQQPANAYTILPCEVDALLGAPRPPPPVIHLIGQESLFWKDFQEAMNEYEELKELTSIKLRNIYSLCTSDEYKKLLLTDLFAPKGPSRLLSVETRDTLARLAQNEQDELKAQLSSVLDAVQQEGLYASLHTYGLMGSHCFILPQALHNHPPLLKLAIDKVRTYFPHATFKKWKEVKPQFAGHIILLDYRDPGQYPFRYHPNIFEYAHANACSIHGLFLHMFFRYNYEYALYAYNNILYSKELDHPIRRTSFDWETLLGQVKRRRPDDSYDHLWDLDNNYSNLADRDLVSITFVKGSKRSFYPTELFVARYADDDQLVIVTAEDIHDDSKAYSRLCIQPLDDLYEGINLFEETLEEESEIKVLKGQYSLPDQLPDSGIWKTLLNRKVEQASATVVYAELRVALSELAFVKQSYFIDNWLDIKSELLIPRSKKVFKVLCDHLGLPGVYFRVMLKRRAKERLASRKSTVQMNRLIARLVEMGLFNDERPTYEFDVAFLLKYDLEEIGFSVEKLTDDLYALADMCTPKLELKEVLTTELKQPS